jgi:heme exporter protein B
MNTFTGALSAVVLRDLRVALRAGGGAGIGVIFFLSLVVIVPFAVGPDMPLLKRNGPAMLWIGALLATLLGLDRIFAADHEDGSLDQLLLSSVPLELIAAAKGFSHWLASGLPLVIVTPLLGLMLGVEPHALATVALTLLVGTPGVTFLGLAAAGLSAALPRGGLLGAVLVLPLAIPLLIFGVVTTNAAIIGEGLGSPFRFLCAISLFFLVLGPVAAAAALRHVRE